MRRQRAVLMGVAVLGVATLGVVRGEARAAGRKGFLVAAPAIGEGERARVAAARELFKAHQERQPVAPAYRMPGAERTVELGTQAKQAKAQVVELRRQGDRAVVELEARCSQEIAALEGYGAWRAFERKVSALRSDKEKAEEKVKKAEWVIDDWARTKESRAWQKKSGIAWQAYYADEETAETVAPRIIRESSREVGRLEGAIAALSDEANRWDRWERQHAAPIRARYARQIETKKGETSRAVQRAQSEETAARDTFFGLVQRGLATAGLDLGQPFRYERGRQYAFDERYTHRYHTTLKEVRSLLETIDVQFAAAERELKVWQVGARKEQRAATAQLAASLDRFFALTGNEALSQQQDAYLRIRSTFDGIAGEVNRFLGLAFADGR
ncbi:MAG: hypothetical protein IT371_03800 [Deltaproteobacteria bacterium]|nr:hypothetical protein [Deltaproteobacteria bacterium]